MSRTKVRPYLISQDGDGDFYITVRHTRFNSQGYPLVSAQRLDTAFPTALKARSYLRAEHAATAADIATA